MLTSLNTAPVIVDASHIPTSKTGYYIRFKGHLPDFRSCNERPVEKGDWLVCQGDSDRAILFYRVVDKRNGKLTIITRQRERETRMLLPRFTEVFPYELEIDPRTKMPGLTKFYRNKTQGLCFYEFLSGYKFDKMLNGEEDSSSEPE